MNIKLASIHLEVANPQHSKRLYIDTLGMTENLERSQPPHFVYLESVGANLTLATPQEVPSAEPSRTMELGFEVDDVEALQARFEEQNVTGFVSQRMGWGDVLEGHDADGHRVIVYAFARR